MRVALLVILCICASHVAETIIDPAEILPESEGQSRPESMFEKEWQPISKDKFLARYADHGANSKELILVRSLFPDSSAVVARDEYARVLARLVYSVMVEIDADIDISMIDKESVIADLRNICQDFLSKTYGNKATFNVDNYAADVHDDALTKFVIEVMEKQAMDEAGEL